MGLKLIDRPSCVLTGQCDLEVVTMFADFPVHMGCTDQDAADDLRVDMCWKQSAGSGGLQLDPVVPLEVVYQGAHNAAIGATWQTHHREFAAFLAEASPTCVTELGGADGFLAHTVLDAIPTVTWTIIDPNPTAPPHPRLEIHVGLFEPGSELPDGTDVVVHSHFLEHVYEPRRLLESITECVSPGTRTVFSVPSMLEQLGNGYANALNFEHTVFLRHEYVVWLLEVCGFEVLRTEFFRDHSVFVDARVTGRPGDAELPDFRTQNRGLLLAFADGMREDARALAARADRFPGEVYVFGAHVFAQYLFAAGLPEERVMCLLDNNPAKQGKRLYGTGLEVAAPDCLAGVANASVILRAAHYNDEIRRQILDEINADVDFW
jgi:hypothetical protein